MILSVSLCRLAFSISLDSAVNGSSKRVVWKRCTTWYFISELVCKDMLGGIVRTGTLSQSVSTRRI